MSSVQTIARKTGGKAATLTVRPQDARDPSGRRGLSRTQGDLCVYILRLPQTDHFVTPIRLSKPTTR